MWALSYQATVAKLGVTQAVNAFDWLVRNGTSVVTKKGGEIAPRTTIGANFDRLSGFSLDFCWIFVRFPLDTWKINPVRICIERDERTGLSALALCGLMFGRNLAG